MVEEVQKLKKKLDGIVKLPVKHRNEPPAAVTKFREDLDKTFKAWPRNVREKMEIQEDIDFLISMEGDRKASIAGLYEKEDIFQKEKKEKEERKKEREEKEKEREVKMKEREAKERKRVQEAFMLPEEIETDYLTNNNNKSQHYLNHCDGNDPCVAVARG